MLVMPTGWELTTKVRTNTQVCMAHDTATKVHRQPRMFPIVRLSSPRGCAIRRAALATPIIRPTPPEPIQRQRPRSACYTRATARETLG